MAATQKIIWVHFFTPVNHETDYFFSSKKAIYKLFTAEQIGLTLESLYVTMTGGIKATGSCLIRVVPVVRMEHGEKIKED